MPGEGVYERTRVYIPHPDGLIITSACDSVSIGTERHAPDPLRMPCEQTDLDTGVCIIEPNTDTARHRNASPVRRVLYVIDSPFTKACFGTFGQTKLCVILGENVK